MGRMITWCFVLRERTSTTWTLRKFLFVEITSYHQSPDSLDSNTTEFALERWTDIRNAMLAALSEAGKLLMNFKKLDCILLVRPGSCFKLPKWRVSSSKH